MCICRLHLDEARDGNHLSYGLCSGMPPSRSCECLQEILRIEHEAIKPRFSSITPIGSSSNRCCDQYHGTFERSREA